MKSANKPQSYWSSKFEFILSIIGFVVDLGNFWRFPEICYTNGGGAFLIPYMFILVFIGIPIMYMELSLGQTFKKANLGVWRHVCPWVKGIGYSVLLINFFIQSYYNTIIAWSLHFVFASIGLTLPWVNYSTIDNITYFKNEVLGESSYNTLGNLGDIQAQLIPLLLIVFVAVYASISKGAVSIGKAVYVTVLVPYALLFVLFIKASTLQGSMNGLKALFTPDFKMLLDFNVWSNAAVQVFFSLGPGFGVLIAYASYTPDEQCNLKIYSIIVPLVNCFTSLLCALVVYSGLGYIANKQNKTIDSFENHQSILVFMVYPEIISTLKAAPLFSFMFFIMVFLLGLDSVYAGIEGMYAAIADDLKWFKNNPNYGKLIIISLCFILSFPSITAGGRYVIDLLDAFGTSPSIMLIVFIETCAVAYYYGANNYANLLQSKCGNRPGKLIIFSWTVTVPIIVFGLYLLSLIRLKDFEYNFGSEDSNQLAKRIGLTISFGSLLPVPVYAIYHFSKRQIKQRKGIKDSDIEISM